MQRALVVVGDHVVHETTDLDRVPGGVETGSADELAYLALHHPHGVGHRCPLLGTHGGCRSADNAGHRKGQPAGSGRCDHRTFGLVDNFPALSGAGGVISPRRTLCASNSPFAVRAGASRIATSSSTASRARPPPR